MGVVGGGADPNFYGFIGDKESSIHGGGGGGFLEMSESGMSIIVPPINVPHVSGPKSKMSQS
jgi:hypothetical protein